MVAAGDVSADGEGAGGSEPAHAAASGATIRTTEPPVSTVLRAFIIVAAAARLVSYPGLLLIWTTGRSSILPRQDAGTLAAHLMASSRLAASVR